jgi:hypothetical protein
MSDPKPLLLDQLNWSPPIPEAEEVQGYINGNPYPGKCYARLPNGYVIFDRGGEYDIAAVRMRKDGRVHKADQLRDDRPSRKPAWLDLNPLTAQCVLFHLQQQSADVIEDDQPPTNR